VRFQLDFVLDAAEPSDSIELLDALPTDMESAYKSVLKRIEKRRLSTVNKILSWLFHAQRPLRRGELREALAVRLGRATLSKPLVQSDMLVQYCQGLVTIDETTETVRFSHFTVKEFLYKHYQDELLSVVDCAKVYLTYMNFDVFEMGPCANVDNYKQRIEDYQFSEYVVLYWGSYTKDRGEKDSDVRGILCKFFRSPGKRAAVRQIQLLFQYPLSSIMRYKLWQLGEDDLNVWTPLHTLANEGLDIFYERITTSGNAAITDGDLRGIEFGTLHSRDEQGCLPLGAASVPGHLTIVTLMIENGADVCAKDNYGSTALHRAAEEGHVEVVKVLIGNDTEINAKENNGRTALHRAAGGGHVEVVKVLIDNDAEINARDNDGETALQCCAMQGHVEVVTVLINNDAEINARHSKGWTALHRAAGGGHVEVVKVLIDNDAEINARDSKGCTALHIAAEEGHVEVVKVLIDNDAEINARDNDGSTALHRAAGGGHVEVVKVLIDNDAEINARDSKGWTALHIAAEEGYVEVVKVLIDNDAEINARDNDGSTALHRAAEEGHVEVVKVLIDNDAEINARDNDGSTALHRAAEEGHVEVVKVLIDNDAEINAKDNDGETALHRAAEEGHVEVVKVLIDNDAEINAKDNDGETALHGAAWYGHGTVISLLCNTLDTSQEAADSVLDDGFSDVIRSLNFLTTKFPEDHIFWEALGNEFLRREMYNDAVNSYDTSVHKLVTGAGIDIECLEFPLSCDECTQLVNGYHYKCKSCPWNTDYCQKCVQDGLEDHQHPVEDLLMIPSQWPLSPHEEEGSTS